MQSNISTKPNFLKRFLSFILDYTIIFIYLWALIIVFGENNGQGARSVSGFPAFTIFLFWFSWTVLAEQLFGSTLGNWVFDLKVISIKNNKESNLSFGQSFKRHFVDILDAIYFIGLILMKNTQYNQRLGDVWAKTIVIDLRDETQYYKRF
ncbi:RDD family protein [Flavobacterium sp.]